MRNKIIFIKIKRMIREIFIGLTMLAAACNGTDSNKTTAVTDSLESDVVDTIPFQTVTDTLEDAVDEAVAIEDTVDINTSGNIEKGEGKNSYNLKDVKQKLVGSWKWEKTKCCGRNARWYTDSLNENRILKFKGDNIVEFYQNGKLQKQEKYLLEEKSVYPDRPQITIGEKTMGPALLEFEGDQMIINYGYMDLQIEYYKKVK